MVAAIRNVDFRQFTSVALATDRHGMSKLDLLIGGAGANGQSSSDSPAAANAGLPAQRSLRRRFDR